MSNEFVGATSIQSFPAAGVAISFKFLDSSSQFFLKNQDIPQKSLSNSIVTQISNFFGVQAEKISIDSAKTIFANIENMVVYLHDKNQDIFVLVNESKTIKNEILLRRDRIVSIKNQFTPIYDKILNIQNRLNNVSKSAVSLWVREAYGLYTRKKKVKSRVHNQLHLYFIINYITRFPYCTLKEIQRALLNLFSKKYPITSVHYILRHLTESPK